MRHAINRVNGCVYIPNTSSDNFVGSANLDSKCNAIDAIIYSSSRSVMNPADCTVIRVSTAEADDVFSLIEEYYDAVQVVARDDRAKLLDYLTDSESGVWLVYCDNSPVGCILYHSLPQKDSAAGEVKRLYVRPPFRRRGIAEELLEKLERFALNRGVEWLYLDTNDDLRVAIAFYERNGYVRCPRYNDNPQATIFMRKRLAPHTQHAGDPRR